MFVRKPHQRREAPSSAAPGDTAVHDRKESGQSLVEFAISLIVLLVMLSGLADLGRAYFVYVAVEDAAGEAATFLSIFPGCPFESLECPDGNNAEDRAVNASNYVGCVDMEMEVLNLYTGLPINTTAQRPGVGEPVLVSIECTINLITPIISEIVGDTGLTLRASASQLVITEKYEFVP